MNAQARYPDLEGKVAVVTGARQGIGAAIARRLAEQGAIAYGIDLRPAHGWPRREPETGTDGVRQLVADVTDDDDLRGAVSIVISEAGGVDIWVNSARSEVLAPLAEMPLAGWDATIAVLLRSHLLAARLIIPIMLDRGGGSIVSVSSPHATFAVARHGAYGVAKAGADRLVKQIAYEYGDRGIRANAVAPGSVATERKLAAMAADPSLRARLIAVQPSGRLVTPDDVAAVVTMLVSTASAMVNGQVIVVDGGLTNSMPSLDLAERILRSAGSKEQE